MVPSVYFSFFCLLVCSVSNFHPDTRGRWWSLIYAHLFSPVVGREEHCMCGECSQCFSRTRFAPAHSVCAFPVYTSQALGHSAKNCLRQALGCMHFPAVQVQVLRYSTKGQTFLGLSSSGDQVLGERSHPPGVGFILSLPPSQLLGFLGIQRAHLLRCAVCLFW